MVKNNKVNAQLAPIDYMSANVTTNLPPTMSRDELLNYEKYHKNVSIENLLNNEAIAKGKP
jgi:hypothetical protein